VVVLQLMYGNRIIGKKEVDYVVSDDGGGSTITLSYEGLPPPLANTVLVGRER